MPIITKEIYDIQNNNPVTISIQCCISRPLAGSGRSGDIRGEQMYWMALGSRHGARARSLSDGAFYRLWVPFTEIR